MAMSPEPYIQLFVIIYNLYFDSLCTSFSPVLPLLYGLLQRYFRLPNLVNLSLCVVLTYYIDSYNTEPRSYGIANFS